MATRSRFAKLYRDTDDHRRRSIFELLGEHYQSVIDTFSDIDDEIPQIVHNDHPNHETTEVYTQSPLDDDTIFPKNETVKEYIARNYTENIEKLLQTAEYFESFGVVRINNVPGDGNCLIYSIIVALMFKCSRTDFMKRIRPFCPSEIFEIFSNHDVDLRNLVFNKQIMKSIAESVRLSIMGEWDYHYSTKWEGHMNNSAIDGLAREMVLRLFCITELVSFCMITENGDKDIRHTIVPTKLQKLRNDVDWIPYIRLFCPYSFTHYCAIIELE